MHAVPGELVGGAAPHDGVLAAVAEDHDEGVDRHRPLRAAKAWTATGALTYPRILVQGL